MQTKALLVLQDGTVYSGISTTGEGQAAGMLAVNTSIVGYQEIATDSSMAGKIVVFSYPLIGNYGASSKFNESSKCMASGIVTRLESPVCSNWQAETTFNDFLRKEGAIAITGIDTRALAIHLRDRGEMPAVISTLEPDVKKLRGMLDNYMGMDAVKETSVKKAVEIKPGDDSSLKIGVLDMGIANSFLNQLKLLGPGLTLLPYNTRADAILGRGFDGLIVSNGPEEGKSIPAAAKTVSGIIGKIPVLGISAGAEIICLSLGGTLRKLKPAHRGMNYPVKPPDSYRGDITVQNHGFAVDESSLQIGAKITLVNVNDGSVEAFESKKHKLMGIQYYPLAENPGEVNDVFVKFYNMVKSQSAQERRYP